MTHEQRLARGDEFRGYAFKVGDMFIHRDDPNRLEAKSWRAKRRHTFADALAVKRGILGCRWPGMRIVSLWLRKEKK